jgi:hypothetical protein
MSANPWDEMTARWREMYEAQSAQAQKVWLDGQQQLSAAFTGAPKMAADTNATALTDLWRSWSTLGNSIWGSAGAALPAMSSMGASPESISLSLASGGAVTDILRRLAEGPRFADVGTSERLMAQVMGKWLSVQNSSCAYESVLAGAWAETNTRFAGLLSERQRDGRDVPTGRAALKTWLDISNDVLVETQRSEKFLAAQRQLLRDGLDFMLVQREFVEALVEPMGLPTRSEIDEIHRTVHELKQRVRAIEKRSAVPARTSPSPAQSE